MSYKHVTMACAFIFTTACLLWAPGALAAIATIFPSQDNTVAEELPDNSSGACNWIFSGMIDVDTLDGARRALMQFDLSSIPPGSNINSVTLNMTVTRGDNHVDSTFTLHPIQAAWVEGVDDCGVRGGGQGVPATDGAVTWNTMPGNGVASASTLVNNTTPSWSSATMLNEVQGWVNGTTPNYGWVLIGDETQQTTTRRFDSREGDSPPALVVDFDCVGDCEACCSGDGTCTTTLVGSGTCSDDPQGTGTTCDPNLCPQPTGACCNVDRTCSDEDRLDCIGNGGIFQGAGVNCNQADCGLEPFVEALPIPPILQPDNPLEVEAGLKPKYTVTVQEAVQNVHPNLPDTTVWTYNGAWPSSTIVATKGVPIEVNYVNDLPTGGGGNRGSGILEVDTCAHGPNDWGNAKRISTHLHGAHLPARFDGQPEYTILPGQNDVYQYPNNQDAATVWYHDHALGITRLNVYGGMAGFYLIRDDEDTLGLGDQDDALDLPSLQYEIGLAVQDRTFNEDGSLFYNAQLEDAFKGEYVVVNGKVNPYLEVDRGKYRFRLLNGSQSREYIYRLENITDPGNDPEFVLIGTDLGLIDAPNNLGTSTDTVVGPAERLDVVIDFAGMAAGDEIILRNDDPTLPLVPNIMKFIVTDQTGHTNELPTTLRAVAAMPESSADVTRYFRFAKHAAQACKDGSGRLVNEWLIESLDGPNGNVTGEFWDDVTEFPYLGTREIWEFENPTNSYHPMHVHLVKFQILDKTDLNGQPIPLQPWEANAWKDIVHIPANSKARIIMDFEDYAGRFPSHCHLLDHEDHEMMRQFQASYDPALCNNDGTCGPGEDCVSCPNDCGQVSGASCGNGLCEAGDGENCATCAEDCAGRQQGGQQNQFCCGFDDGQVTNPVGCDVLNPNDNRCINGDDGLACRETARLSACCGDKLCEGAETEVSCANDCDPNVCTPTELGAEYSCSDGQDNDCDGLIDAADPDCLDPDGDGLTNAYEINISGTDPNNIDSDGDGLVDGNDGVVVAGTGDVDANGDGFVDGEQTSGTDPNNEDSDGDLLKDGLEVANGADPLDPLSYPILADGDVAPYGAPDGQLNVGDLAVAIRVALGMVDTRTLELAHCDLGVPDGIINSADILLLIQMLQSQPSP